MPTQVIAIATVERTRKSSAPTIKLRHDADGIGPQYSIETQRWNSGIFYFDDVEQLRKFAREILTATEGKL